MPSPTSTHQRPVGMYDPTPAHHHSALELAGMISNGRLAQAAQVNSCQRNGQMPPAIPPKSAKISPPVPPKPRRSVSHLTLHHGNKPLSPLAGKEENYYSPEPLTKLKSQSKPNVSHLKGGLAMLPHSSSPKLSFKTSSKSNGSLGASLLSLSGSSGSSNKSGKTPKISRKASSARNNNKNSKPERTITIKCQRMKEGCVGEYEIVEVEVPQPIYDTLRMNSDVVRGQGQLRGQLSERSRSQDLSCIGIHHEKKNSLSAKIKNLFGKA